MSDFRAQRYVALAHELLGGALIPSGVHFAADAQHLPDGEARIERLALSDERHAVAPGR
jgi:hypothetical protein